MERHLQIAPADAEAAAAAIPSVAALGRPSIAVVTAATPAVALYMVGESHHTKRQRETRTERQRRERHIKG